MNRVLWFVAGAGAGAYALTRARRAAEVLTPEGLSDRLAGLSVGARMFGEEVREGMAEKEDQVRHNVGVALHGTPRAELSVGSGPRAPQRTDNSVGEDD